MAIGTVQLVTKAEYARLRGCSEGAVRRAIRDGRISEIDGKVDPVAADAQWQRNTRVRAGSRSSDDVNISAPPTAQPDGEDYWQIRTRRERAEAEIAELKLQEMNGSLVRVEAVRSSLARRAATFRESLLQIPGRLAAQLAAETEQPKIHALLDAELRAAMAYLTTEA